MVVSRDMKQREHGGGQKWQDLHEVYVKGGGLFTEATEWNLYKPMFKLSADALYSLTYSRACVYVFIWNKPELNSDGNHLFKEMKVLLLPFFCSGVFVL